MTQIMISSYVTRLMILESSSYVLGFVNIFSFEMTATSLKVYSDAFGYIITINTQFCNKDILMVGKQYVQWYKYLLFSLVMTRITTSSNTAFVFENIYFF